MEIMESPATNNADAISVDVAVGVFNVNDVRQANLFLRIEQIEYSDHLLRCARLSQVTCFRPSLCMYAFHYSPGTLSMTFHPGLNAKGVTTFLTSVKTTSRQDLRKAPTVLLLDRHHYPEEQCQLKV